ncbi:hypothetical protein WICMUC_000896 [Wickerhamomyces mucosus]|uniref:Mannosyltransferase n=1 Tax=Wickerhamomyces mucosus TaxID=1378264 RepID=A0A9P8THA5_9ASCO|nr:hypothetical protein WICMUC_000896 [Wickerhamomyces mucosus]
MINWRTIHYISYIALIFFAFEPSYLHPDEHFQTFEVLTNYHLGYRTTIPWEFSINPSRSFAILSLIYSPLILLNKFFKFPPIGLLYLFRLQFLVTYFFIAHYTTRILSNNIKKEYTKSLFFIFTSYITWTYQSHSFSNSIETQLLLITLSIIHLILKGKTKTPEYLLTFLLGILIPIGEFNRITFIGFLILPSIKLIKHYWTFKFSALLLVSTIVLISYILILIDTKFFGSDNYIITPLNNLLYNTEIESLQHHGLHPRYTHILINLPQIIGPIIIPFLFRNHYKSSLSYLSVWSGIISLSIFPHQELRFLIPLLPLVSNCIDFQSMENPNTVNRIIKVWIGFNLFFGILMGSLHQRGVLVALEYLRSNNYEGSQIWWKTYKPPTWLLGSTDLNISIDEIQHGNNNLVDLMGAHSSKLVEAISVLGNDIILITPRSSIPILESINKTISYELIWRYHYHLDFDHFDFDDMRTFHPGIDIYSVSLL